MGLLIKNGQIVNNKIFFGMLGTIPNHECEYVFVFILVTCLGGLIDSVSAWSLRGCRIECDPLVFFIFIFAR